VTKPQRAVLVIFDGWGHNPDDFGNAIKAASTPNFDALRQAWPNTTIEASGEAVGLPAGQQGNSEVGHLSIGTGRIVRQPLSRQHHELSSGSFYDNETLITAIELAKQRGTALHILGLVSPGGVHSHPKSGIALVRLAAKLGLDRVYVHAITDGRDVPPASAQTIMSEFESELADIGIGHVASMSGRYYAMDRDGRWDRIQLAYDMLVHHEHPTVPTAAGYIDQSYRSGETDEFFKPISIAATPEDRVKIDDGDVVIFFNFRPDRARQLTHALVDVDFTEFPRRRIVKDLHLVTFGEYDRTLTSPVAFPKPDIQYSLAETVSSHGKHQFHIAETEKYAHVTYFLNGGVEEAFTGEDRQMVSSLKVATYDLAPAMSAAQLTDIATTRITGRPDDLVVINYANADMVGHTGNFAAIVSAIETLDTCMGRIITAALSTGAAVLITADHGNAEYKIDLSTNLPLSAHTTNPVPVLLCGTKARSLRAGAGLSDVAPTVLEVMGLPIPAAMTGRSLACY
jgi:2,3-bisphosphoglycerate-independent phosphoglycerate mutase